MKTNKIFTVQKIMMMMFVMLCFTSVAFGQGYDKMNDVFTDLYGEVSSTTPMITKVCYVVGGICFFVAIISLTMKIIKGQEVGKEIGLYFGAMAIFVLAGWMCQKFMS